MASLVVVHGSLATDGGSLLAADVEHSQGGSSHRSRFSARAPGMHGEHAFVEWSCSCNSIVPETSELIVAEVHTSMLSLRPIWVVARGYGEQHSGIPSTLPSH
jgi:hypothetical protein